MSMMSLYCQAVLEWKYSDENEIEVQVHHGLNFACIPLFTHAHKTILNTKLS